MNIGIYNPSFVRGFGGAGYTVAVLAQALARRHRVEIVHHAAAFSLSHLESFAGLDLDGVRLRYLDRAWVTVWPARLSARYDLFINLTLQPPPPSHARVSVLRVLFPLVRPAAPASDGGHGALRRWLRRAKRARELRHGPAWAATYQLKVANSHFTREWARRRWDLDCEVVHSPVDLHFPLVPKARLVLSVGRFSPFKKQMEMVTAFRGLAARAHGWRYVSAGILSPVPQHRRYLEQVRSAAGEGEVEILVDVDHTMIRRTYAEASIFWHAAGFGEDLEANPELAEHFGIVTVEAMGAGCVPVVYDAGGQREIVEHGVNGYRWRTLEELQEYTACLMADDRLRAQMASAARERAVAFGRDRFLARLGQLLARHCEGLGTLED